jgi:hypothetical protein
MRGIEAKKEPGRPGTVFHDALPEAHQGPLTIANVQVDVYVPMWAFAGTASWKVSVTFVWPFPVAAAAL